MKNACLLFFLFLLGIQSSKAQYADIHDFNGLKGANPQGSLTVSGNKLYGMTDSGGAYKYGCIFSINTDGSGYKDLLDFNGAVSPQGAYPYGSLIISDSVLYGMTFSGGSNNYGCIFSVDTNGNGYTDIHDFAGHPTDGANPHGSLTLSGNKLFGMTLYGGEVHTGSAGTAFSLNINGSNFKVLITFDFPGQAFPYGSPTLSGGKFFGMTEQGGGYGDVISIDTNGNNFKDIWDFGNAPLMDTTGLYPYGSLTISGNILYGMTSLGGTQGYNLGRIFSIDTDGTNFSPLHNFNGTNGSKPNGSLIKLQNMVYGMTPEGGVNGYGCIFSLNVNDTAYTDMYDFNGTEGMYPYGDLVLSGNTLYGMTSSGGANDSGVIFSFKSPELGIKEVHSSSCFTNIYPNPSNGNFSISLIDITDECYVEVYNVMGEKIYARELNSNTTQIDLSNQASGVYFYRVLTETSTLISSGKFIIEH